MVRKILQIGCQELTNISSPVKFPLSAEDKKTIADLLDTAKDVGDKGAGLSAPQLAINKRVTVCRRVDIEELIYSLNNKLLISEELKSSPTEFVKALIDNSNMVFGGEIDKIQKHFNLKVSEKKLNKSELNELFKKVDDLLWMVVIDPEVTFENDYETIYWEGCLSVGAGKTALYAPVARTEIITFTYFDTDGQKHEMKTKNYFAHVVLHEIDHMEGVLFLSRVDNIENIWKAEELDNYIKAHKKYPEIKD
ncbi:MAG: peptide deformylase [bacterium]